MLSGFFFFEILIPVYNTTNSKQLFPHSLQITGELLGWMGLILLEILVRYITEEFDKLTAQTTKKISIIYL